MSKVDTAGLDIDTEQVTKEEPQKEKVLSIKDAREKRRPFHYWTVAGTEYRMKLQASMVLKLEQKYGMNITNVIFKDDTPPLAVMLTIAQAAMAPWEHGTSIDRVSALYDTWVNEDNGNQQDFLAKVIMPTMVVSGFFTESQGQMIMKAAQEAESLN